MVRQTSPVSSSITKIRQHIETRGAWLHAMRRGIASVPENGREDGEERKVPPPRARRELLEREVPFNLDKPPKINLYPKDKKTRHWIVMHEYSSSQMVKLDGVSICCQGRAIAG